MSDFTDEFDYILERGWWFSIIPEGSKDNKWRCSVYRKKPNGSWDAVKTKQFPTITKGMIWIETYLLKKLEDMED